MEQERDRFTLYVGDRMFSSWSVRATLVLVESGVEFLERLFELDWPVRFEGNRALPMPLSEMDEEPASGCICEVSQLLRAEPTGLLASSFLSEIPRVPFLLDHDHKLLVGDVVAIAEYLAEEFPVAKSLIGDNTKRRASIRTFVAHMHADYLPLMSGMSYSKSFRMSPKYKPTEAALYQAQILNRVLTRLLRGNHGSFLFGKFSLADIMVAPIAQAWSGWGYLTSTSLQVQEYVKLLFQRESIAAALSDARSYYTRIQGFEEESAPWIARHYRLNTELSLIHNWRTDVFHELNTDVAVKMFTLAFEGKSDTEIVSAVVQDYEVSHSQAEKDVRDFFHSISPSRDQSLSGQDFFLTVKNVS